MTLVGMDTDAVRQISQGLGSQADRIDMISRTVEALVGEALETWRGQDAGRFAEEWSSTHRPALDALRQVVQELAQVAAANAEEQDAASGDGSSGSGSGQPGSGWVVASGSAETSGTLAGAAWKADASYQLGADAKAEATLDGKGLKAEAGVWAGLTATAGITATRGILSGGARVDGFVGAKAEAKAQVGVLGAKASSEVFAGAKIEGTAEAAVAGVGAKGTAEGWYGVGYKLEGTATFENGKLTLGGEAGAALGLGGALGGEVQIDVVEVVETLGDAADAVGDLFE